MDLKQFLDEFLPAGAPPKCPYEGDPEYERYGYLSRNLAVRQPVNMMYLGCSWTCGPQPEEAFPFFASESLSKVLGVPVGNWNMGVGGQSADFISRMLISCLRSMRPDGVFLLFPSMDRREYFTARGRHVRYQIDWIDQVKTKHRFWNILDPIAKHVISHMNELISPYDDLMNFVRNYKLMEASLNVADIPWGFSTVPGGIEEVLPELLDRGWLDRSRYLGAYKVLDTVSGEDTHPGPFSRRAFADRVANMFASKYFDQLSNAAARRPGAAQ